jgi:hypothetical protein
VPEVLPAQLGDLVGETGDACPVAGSQFEPRAVEEHRLDHLLVATVRRASQRMRERVACLVEAVEVHQPERLDDAWWGRARHRVDFLLERERFGQRILLRSASGEEVDQEEQRRRVCVRRRLLREPLRDA